MNRCINAVIQISAEGHIVIIPKTTLTGFEFKKYYDFEVTEKDNPLPVGDQLSIATAICYEFERDYAPVEIAKSMGANILLNPKHQVSFPREWKPNAMNVVNEYTRATAQKFNIPVLSVNRAVSQPYAMQFGSDYYSYQASHSMIVNNKGLILKMLHPVIEDDMYIESDQLFC